MNPVAILILLGIAFISAYIHKSKGYSALSGFLWGFFFTIIGLAVVLLEKDKSENDAITAKNKGLSFANWLFIFLGIGILLIILLFLFI